MTERPEGAPPEEDLHPSHDFHSTSESDGECTECGADYDTDKARQPCAAQPCDDSECGWCKRLHCPIHGIGVESVEYVRRKREELAASPPKTHAWQPEWRLWERIQTALLAVVPFLDDADNDLRSEIADLNAVLPNLRDPAQVSDAAPVAWLPHVKARLNTWAANLDSRGSIADTPLTIMAGGLRMLANNPGQFLAHPEDAPRITMTKSYLSGRQCCDFTIAEDDSETHEDGCPWRIVDEFANRALGRIQLMPHGDSDVEWLEHRICELVEDMTSSLVRRVEDAPGGPWEDSEARLPIWLVWQLHTDGRVYLQAVTTNPQLAADYRTGLLKTETTVRAYVEVRETNHGFGLSMITPLLKNSGDLDRLKGEGETDG